MRLQLKGCPRCGGDLIRQWELNTDGVVWSCLQCGHLQGEALPGKRGAPALAGAGRGAEGR